MHFELRRISVRNVRSQSKRLIPGMVLTFTLAVALVFAPQPAQAQTFTVLYTFTGGTDGGQPYAGLIVDSKVNLYGTTSEGGSGLLGCPKGCGTVFKVDSSGNETVLHTFGETTTDGASPLFGSLIRDNAGNLYGTTSFGGTYDSGTIFRLSTSGKETVFSFAGGAKGGFPYAGLTPDSAGNVYGTTYYRGTGCPPYGCGTVFKVSSAGKETVLYSFTGGADGGYLWDGVVRDSAGNLYGTTLNGGTSNYGTVFKVDPSGNKTILHSFTEGEDGGDPYAGLIRDSAGNLYGTTSAGGSFGAGTVFKVDSTGNETVLYNFCSKSQCEDGEAPFAGLAMDSAGNLYGTTLLGGFDLYYGVVFKLDPTGKETVLYNFTGSDDGGLTYAGVVQDSAGNIYGTTPSFGAYGYGTVFKITP
jgi:uncharacterized repeat protein (TIGR03803 family)